MSDLFSQLADDLQLSEEDRSEKLPSGKQFTYRNHIGWARTYLKKAGLLEIPDRGLVQITDAGRAVLSSPPAVLNVRFLKQFPSFVEFHTMSRERVVSPEAGVAQDSDEETPEEQFEKIYDSLTLDLVDEILVRVKAAPPQFFERLVVDLLLLSCPPTLVQSLWDRGRCSEVVLAG